MRETEDGVNRALLISAVEEIKRLQTESPSWKGKPRDLAYRRAVSGRSSAATVAGGVDSAQMAKLTTELARLEEDNGRQKWMIGEKDKQIKEVQGKYAASAAYALQEKLQESMEALEVMANLQAEQLQYMEDHALRKLDAQDTQIADVQDDLDTKRAHLEQLKTLMAGTGRPATTRSSRPCSPSRGSQSRGGANRVSPRATRRRRHRRLGPRVGPPRLRVLRTVF